MQSIKKRPLILQYHLLFDGLKKQLIKLFDRLIPDRTRLINIGSGYRQSRLLYLAVKLEIADQIGDENASIDLLSKRLSIDAGKLYRLLRTLSSLGIFTETTHRTFANNRLSALLRQSNNKNVRINILIDNSKEQSNVWFDKIERQFSNPAVSSKLSAKKTTYFEATPSNTELGLSLMRPQQNALEEINWSKFDVVFDVGHAEISNALAILAASPELYMCIYAHSDVIQQAKNNWLQAQIHSALLRVSFEQGDLLKAIPSASSHKNIYFFYRLFCELSDQHCLTVLQNVRKAMGSFKATIAITDFVLPELDADRLMALSDMQKLLQQGGKERTLCQWTSLFAKSPFKLIERVNLRNSQSVLVLAPR